MRPESIVAAKDEPGRSPGRAEVPQAGPKIRQRLAQATARGPAERIRHRNRARTRLWLKPGLRKPRIVRAPLWSSTMEILRPRKLWLYR